MKFWQGVARGYELGFCFSIMAVLSLCAFHTVWNHYNMPYGQLGTYIGEATFLMLTFMFAKYFFTVWAKWRFDMYVMTIGEQRDTYMRLKGEEFIVPMGQELVIRQSETEPGKVDVFTGKVTQ